MTNASSSAQPKDPRVHAGVRRPVAVLGSIAGIAVIALGVAGAAPSAVGLATVSRDVVAVVADLPRTGILDSVAAG